MQLKWGNQHIFICIAKQKKCSLNELVKIQYLLWMLNTIYCTPDEKDFPKHVYIVYFSCTSVLKMKQKKPNIYS